ncbi:MULTISPECIES: sulfite oxidase [Pseudofrankia]|uniref:sulfite oxidase n=1 Tax=Pseudofrankia TaxID=2994363 RepID=UPI000234BC4D|nr:MULTISPECIES: sulfite oxidase [Pseudofrankia]OHV36014.1 sulfite oxidase [Pseudofrankia sp. EUN1h]
MIVYEEEPFNAEPPAAALADRPVTPLDTFYSRNHGPILQIDPDSWRLRVDGVVRRPLVLSLAQLRARFPERTVVATLLCAGNRRAELAAVRPIPDEVPWGPGVVSTARWTGVSLADVLASAEPWPDAAHVAFGAADVSELADPPQPFGGSVPMSKAMAGEVLLAWEMDGAPLPPAHGAPVRVVVPGYIGARSVKWVEHIHVQERPSDNYFQATAYRLLPADADPADAPGTGLSLGPLAVNAAILTPGQGQTLPPGPNRISGYAIAGDGRGVARVDVRVETPGPGRDTGTGTGPDANGASPWRQADLGPAPSPWAWRLWETTVRIPPGPVDIVARAWDTSATVQPEQPATLWNPKGYGNNAWTRVRVTGRAA